MQLKNRIKEKHSFVPQFYKNFIIISHDLGKRLSFEVILIASTKMLPIKRPKTK